MYAPAEAIHRLAHVRRIYGTGAALKFVGDRLLNRLLHFDVADVLWLETGHRSSPSAVDTPFDFRFLATSEVMTFADDPSNDLPSPFARRLAAGQDRCFAALHEGRLAGYCWFASTSIEPEHCGGVALAFPADVVYTYKGFTHPEFRGQGLYSALLTRGFNELQPSGVKKMLATVHWTNWPSLRCFRRIGCTNLGRMVVVRLGALHYLHAPEALQALGIQAGAPAMISIQDR